jgi:hypothetical protein
MPHMYVGLCENEQKIVLQKCVSLELSDLKSNEGIREELEVLSLLYK